MTKNDDDYYERQSELLERFLSKNDKSAFMKMLNMNINPNIDKEKENNHKKVPDFMKSMKNKKPSHYYNYFHMKQPYNNNNNNNDLFNYNNNYNDNQVNSYKLDFHNILQDPEYKDKCMKGNYKWGSMKFQMMKVNLAKRKGVSVDKYQMPKIADRRKSNMELNGQFVMDNNPLTNSVNIERRNSQTGIRDSLKIKLGKINQDQIIRRQLTQKVKPTIHKDEINTLDINF